ncbi:BON domain protein [Thalassoglobus neptunius]|uniref:BON domain protein n=1 Tax=Thalassoglobus neptunius TaxID=1938619 RepID=A0A5C5WM98_9PLAN|nr:BON domain-containing protein [Thalassoglobus neptunius]TWT51944.1 BON domain protein [Thalassoglobus neptunius]
MQTRILTLATALMILTTASNAQAQSLFGGGTTTGGGTTGGTGGSAAGVGRTTQGGGGTTFAAQGGSLIDPGRAAGDMVLNTGDGSLSSMVGQNAFTGFSSDSAFIGGNTAASQSFTNNRAQFGGLQGRGNTGGGQNGRGQGQTDRKPVRPQYRMAFTAPALPVQQLESSLKSSLLELPHLAYSNRTVELSVDENGVATISGTVNSEREMKSVESYVRMEPGVRKVANQLIIQQ